MAKTSYIVIFPMAWMRTAPDFREVVEKVLKRFSDVDFDYLDNLPMTGGYNFLLCTYCQAVRSTPFAIYRITPETSGETFIAIGMSIALEKQFEYKIPKILLAENVQDIPSLLAGYEIVVARNDQDRKNRLREFVPEVIQKVRETTWRSRPLPFETIMLPRGDRYLPNEAESEKEEPVTERTVEATEASSAPLKDYLLSYNSVDRDWANWIAWQIEDMGYSVIFQALSLQESNQWLEMKDTQRAKSIVLILSPNYLKAEAEWASALAQDSIHEQGKFVPVHVRECRNLLKDFLVQINYIDLVGKDELVARDVLIKELNRRRVAPMYSRKVEHLASQRPSFPENKSVLVVEDDEDIGEFIAQALNDETPHTIFHVVDGRHALEVAASLKPDLFILDYQLPDMNGIELYDRLQAVEGLENAPAIVIGASIPEWEIKKRKLSGLKKPFDINELLVITEELFGKLL